MDSIGIRTYIAYITWNQEGNLRAIINYFIMKAD